MNDPIAAVLAAFLAACGAVAGSVVERWRHQRVDEATAERTTVETAERVVALLRDELDRERAAREEIQAELSATRTELAEAHRELRSLREQVADLEGLVATMADPMPGGRRRTDPPL